MDDPHDTRAAWRTALSSPRVLVLLALLPVAAGAALWTGSLEAAVWVLAASLAAGGCPACLVLRSLTCRRGACTPDQRDQPAWTPPPGI